MWGRMNAHYVGVRGQGDDQKEANAAGELYRVSIE